MIKLRRIIEGELIMYNLIIIGAGPAGFFCAYEYHKLNKTGKVLVIDKGVSIYERNCPILDKKIEKCPAGKKEYPGCHPACSITCGFGGAGAYSDGKFNITDEFGGWLGEYISKEKLLSLIEYVDSINILHGATHVITNPNTIEVREIERKGIAAGLKLLRAKVRHLGTEENLKIMMSIYEYLKSKVEFKFRTVAENIIVENGIIKGIITSEGEILNAKNVLIAPGRDGSMWLNTICKKHQIKQSNNQVDIGVRVETNNVIMEEINTRLYEGKFVFNTSVNSLVRTFCSNPSGHVVIENYNGTMLANGHAYYDKSLGSDNTNFALLVSHNFADPYDNPNEYGHAIGRIANKLSCGSVIVQRFGDLINGRRTTDKRLKNGFVKPTLKEAVPGDLGLVLPFNTLKSIIETIYALDKITPGIANEHTLLYGVETKFYSARPEVDDTLESKIKGLYFGGDGAGITRGLAQAGASGVLVARSIFKKS